MMRMSLILLLATGAALAGCLDDAGTTADDQEVVDDVLDPTGPVTETVAGTLQLAATTPARAFNYGGTFSTPVALAENETGLVVELVWDASSPASEELDLWVREEGAGTVPPSSVEDWTTEPVATATGTSPLRLELPADLLGTTSYEVIVRAGGPVGVAYEQAYELHLTTFTGAFDPDFTALEE